MNKVFDLEERTLLFSKKTITFLKTLKKDVFNLNLVSQYIRSATSIGANYREANDALGKKDFLLRIKICRKEAKETLYWFDLILHAYPERTQEVTPLLHESKELVKIFSSIAKKVDA